MTTYSMTKDLIDRIRKPSWTMLDTMDYIHEHGGIQFSKFDETHVYFNIVDSKKLLLFLLKV